MSGPEPEGPLPEGPRPAGPEAAGRAPEEPELAGVDPEDRSLIRLADRLGYPRGTLGRLPEAVTHKSYANERHRSLPHNERLEFLGDAVLGLVVAEALMRAHPERDEGELSRLRASLVNAASLAEVARVLGIGEALRLGRGEERTGGRGKHNLLADGFEACLGAVFCDLGFGAARRVVVTWLGSAIARGESRRQHRDFKTRLQELAQAALQRTPSYLLIEARGPDHEKEFEVELRLGSIVTRGLGRSKKAAEREAAALAYRILEEQACAAQGTAAPKPSPEPLPELLPEPELLPSAPSPEPEASP